ncbi:integral membrane sensor signal transduction histidine kinase [Parasphaerochaeta coccoides DSM 17374]|uniref:histidine kinase n=2 Tax=Parasphaerochaeta TaxID=3062336 RepID=F4GHJ7_PARC1|nr:integral membrane sensor signal transduction histidine kinase [Parasphaerochaeta coccoides DSM 17374]
MGRQANSFVISLVFIVVLVLAVTFGLIVVLSHSITRPVNRIIAHIRRMPDSGFSYDASIETSKDEFAGIGKTLNEMSTRIQELLEITGQMYEQKQRQEIALLQSQVNPHFLYNTLESIRWMAKVQKNKGIEEMTRSLSNLLKQLSKGTDERIFLANELELVRDYVAIQQIRYVGTFDFIVDMPGNVAHAMILKFSLQPIVENAIYHGIEPSGEFGTITVTCRHEGDVLEIIVEDDGVGMEETLVDSLQKKLKRNSVSQFSGIGMSNVHERLRLTYGEEYGLAVTSRPGQGTRVTITVPWEDGDV